MNAYLENLLSGRPCGLDVLDLHGHLGIFGFAIPDYDPAVLVRGMDRMGIRSVVCSSMRVMSADCEAGNREVYEATRAFPGRILGYVSVFPGDGPESVAEQVTRWADAGFVGLKFHNHNGYAYDHEGYIAACEIADERHMPLLLHTWGQEEVFAEISRLARRFTRMHFLLAHSGSANIQGYFRMVREHPNVHLDTAYSRVPIGLMRRLVEGAGPDRVIWGSDVYFFSQSHQLGAMLGSGLDEATLRKVLVENAAKILHGVKRP
jgi:predicted TIM-barrel fold metal-dependent hydrolase